MADTKRNRPSRATEAIPKTFGGVGSSVVDSADTHPDHAVCWECQQAVWDAGVEYGQRRANRLAAQAIAQELLSAQAAEMAGLARREASRVGPAWADLVTGVGE